MTTHSTLIPHADFKHFFTVSHPLLKHKLSLLRDRHTPNQQFRQLVNEITLLLAYEVTRELPMTTCTIQTPLTEMVAPCLAGKKPVIVPILRAGLGMLDGFLSLMPVAKIGHVGLYRDEKTLKPVPYYLKIPKDIAKRRVYVCDPMLATGSSAVEAIDELKQQGAQHITFVCLVASPQGMRHLCTSYPDLPVYAGALDETLSDNGYILPGLGDAGDRLFGTY